MRIEIGVESLAGVQIAAAAGADRVELSCGLTVGGLTPSPALIEQAVAVGVPIHVLIRPRPGGFVYAPEELAVMRRDIEFAGSLGAAGVVVGVLDPDGELDSAACAALLDAASAMQATLHRAIDVSADSERTLERAIELGFTRVLTSGRRRCALDGSMSIRALHARAAGAIEVMACGGVRAGNALQVLETTGVTDLHAAPVKPLEPRHWTPGAEVSFGGHDEPDAAGITALCTVIRNVSPRL